MTDQEQFKLRTGFNTYEDAVAHMGGYNQAMKDIRNHMTAIGQPTSWVDAMLDQLQQDENDWFATDVIGG